MLRRVLKHADTRMRQISYMSLLRSVLEYGCIVWDPYYLKKNIKRSERIQNMALQFVFRIKRQVSRTDI